MILEEKQKFNKINYILRTPKHYDNKMKCPAIIFLHGAGSRGHDIDVLQSNPYFVETKEFEYDIIL